MASLSPSSSESRCAAEHPLLSTVSPITVAGQTNTINAGGRFSYLAPKITAVYPDYGSTLQHVTKLDREDGRFFHRRFTDGDVNADGVLTSQELRGLLSISEALRGVIDLTARDADFTFNALDFDQSEWCLSVVFRTGCVLVQVCTAFSN